MGVARPQPVDAADTEALEPEADLSRIQIRRKSAGPAARAAGPAADGLFCKKGGATAEGFRPSYWVYESATEVAAPDPRADAAVAAQAPAAADPRFDPPHRPSSSQPARAPPALVVLESAGAELPEPEADLSRIRIRREHLAPAATGGPLAASDLPADGLFCKKGGATAEGFRPPYWVYETAPAEPPPPPAALLATPEDANDDGVALADDVAQPSFEETLPAPLPQEFAPIAFAEEPPPSMAEPPLAADAFPAEPVDALPPYDVATDEVVAVAEEPPAPWFEDAVPTSSPLDTAPVAFAEAAPLAEDLPLAVDAIPAESFEAPPFCDVVANETVAFAEEPPPPVEEPALETAVVAFAEEPPLAVEALPAEPFAASPFRDVVADESVAFADEPAAPAFAEQAPAAEGPPVAAEAIPAELFVSTPFHDVAAGEIVAFAEEPAAPSFTETVPTLPQSDDSEVAFVELGPAAEEPQRAADASPAESFEPTPFHGVAADEVVAFAEEPAAPAFEDALPTPLAEAPAFAAAAEAPPADEAPIGAEAIFVESFEATPLHDVAVEPVVAIADDPAAPSYEEVLPPPLPEELALEAVALAAAPSDALPLGNTATDVIAAFTVEAAEPSLADGQSIPRASIETSAPATVRDAESDAAAAFSDDAVRAWFEDDRTAASAAQAPAEAPHAGGRGADVALSFWDEAAAAEIATLPAELPPSAEVAVTADRPILPVSAGTIDAAAPAAPVDGGDGSAIPDHNAQDTVAEELSAVIETVLSGKWYGARGPSRAWHDPITRPDPRPRHQAHAPVKGRRPPAPQSAPAAEPRGHVATHVLARAMSFDPTWLGRGLRVIGLAVVLAVAVPGNLFAPASPRGAGDEPVSQTGIEAPIPALTEALDTAAASAANAVSPTGTRPLKQPRKRPSDPQ